MLECIKFSYLTTVANRKPISARLRYLRTQKGLTQHALAQSAGLSTKTISNIEKSNSLPNLCTLICLSKQLEVSVGYFLDSFSTSGENTRRKELIYEIFLIANSLADKEIDIAVEQLKAFRLVTPK